MTNLRGNFKDAVGQIIHQELDDIQQDQYAIEGEEIISSLFASNSIPDYSEENDLLLDFGIAPGALEIKEADITFLDVINSCFSLLQANRGIGIDAWKTILMEEQTHPMLIDLLCKKYNSVIGEIIKQHE